ncbi:hypothetical protein SEA_YAGO84_50 [Gordonia phage Yago84]|nr:hypothetical protein SEA_YAGO84_50 [Gordonia phage Yago84]QIG58978.1 hypothetical protein SEA_ANCLAR_51 [Gordonia phage AnClar]WIC90032.1 hypothetical protein SEA_SISKO_50 [Gordonia phage Sisko]
MSAPVAGLCAGCGEAVTETLGGAIHLDGFYTCTTGAVGDGDGFAELVGFWDLEQDIASQREEAAADAIEHYECECCEDNHAGIAREARSDALADVVRAVDRL